MCAHYLYIMQYIQCMQSTHTFVGANKYKALSASVANLYARKSGIHPFFLLFD